MDAGGFLYSKAEIQTMALEDNTKHLNYSILQKSKRIYFQTSKAMYWIFLSRRTRTKNKKH